jgi:uncharacterized membrane protein
MYDVMGLPLHPLVVHAVVVLLPLGALGLIACVVMPRWRRGYAGLSVLGLLAGTGAAWVAASAGHALAEKVGTPVTHMAWGDWLPRVATLTLVLAAVWYFLQRGKDQQSTLARVLGIGAAVAAVATVGLTTIVGHSGATAVWGGSVAAPVASPSRGASSGSASYTLDQVKQHNSAGDCWVAINDGVYNLTAWVNQHPGGPDKIMSICGTDATAAFEAQHSGDQRPESTLTGFYIGALT